MKLQWLLFFLIAILLIVVEFLLFANLEIIGTRPDLTLILAIYITLSVESKEALVASWLLGILRDTTSGEYFGMFAICYMVAAILTIKFKEGLFIDKFIVPTIFVFALAFQCNLFHVMTIFVLYGTNFFVNALLCTLYTTILTPVLIFLLEKIKLIQPCPTR